MRAKNFNETDDLADLLDPVHVAKRVQEILMSDITGSVVRVY